jgi:phage/plasmid-associated DNA primase
MNEVELTKTKDIQNKIKSFVSEDSITINPKGIRPYSVRNLARMIYTTNKDISTVIDAKAKDRRNVIFEATKKYTDPKLKTLWTKAREQFKTKDFLNKFTSKIAAID